LKESGQVTAILTATDRPRPGLRWIQMDDNWSLENLVARVFSTIARLEKSREYYAAK
jgi:hypothetical protein